MTSKTQNRGTVKAFLQRYTIESAEEAISIKYPGEDIENDEKITENDQRITEKDEQMAKLADVINEKGIEKLFSIPKSKGSVSAENFDELKNADANNFQSSDITGNFFFQL